jgi:hypothetical protein
MPKRKPKKLIHRVTGNLNVVEFTKAASALTLAIYESNRKLGTIVIGQGSFTWYGTNRRKPVWWNWTRFSEIMNREAYND